VVSFVSLLVLMSTHNNQKELTSCLTALVKSASKSEFVVSLANSGDTVSIPMELENQVVITKVSNDSFWAESMYQASSAIKFQNAFTHLLWLNDDVSLFPNSIDDLIDLMAEKDADIVVGQTCSLDGDITYGGFLRESLLKPLHLQPVIAIDEAVKAETFNGNVVLIRTQALTRMGAFLRGYKHYLADIAYGLHATSKGLEVIVAPGFSGTCKANDTVNLSLDKQTSRIRRLMILNAPQGLPIIQQLRFSLRYGRYLGILYFVSTYLRFLWTLLTYEKSQPEIKFDS